MLTSDVVVRVSGPSLRHGGAALVTRGGDILTSSGQTSLVSLESFLQAETRGGGREDAANIVYAGITARCKVKYRMPDVV